MSELRNLPKVTMLTLDVVKKPDIVRAVEVVTRETGGTLDYLINNAGHNHFMPILDEDIPEVKRLFEINVWGPLAITQAFSPLVIKAKGSFIFITSIAGYANIPWMGTYSASKRSLEIIAEALRLEMKPFDVNVLSVVTGSVKSKGQTYFQDWAVPEHSLYKKIEPTMAQRVRGLDHLPRMPTMEYATAVVDAITTRTTEKFWCGSNVEGIKASLAPPIPHEALDDRFMMGTGLDTWVKDVDV